MKHLNWFQNWIVRFCRVQPFDVNEALKQQWRNGKQKGVEEGRLEKADCLVCPLWRADHIRLTGIQTPGYEQPSPTTSGKIVAQQGARSPAITRQLSPLQERTSEETTVILNPHGSYFQNRHQEFLRTNIHPTIHKMSLLNANDDWLL